MPSEQTHTGLILQKHNCQILLCALQLRALFAIQHVPKLLALAALLEELVLSLSQAILQFLHLLHHRCVVTTTAYTVRTGINIKKKQRKLKIKKAGKQEEKRKKKGKKKA
jgi:hypothetical protein